MKKNFSLILSLVMFLSVIMFKPSIAAKAVDYHNGTNYNYDEVVVGANNLNNTSSNSAKVGDSLLMPEKGWKRYDDKYSKFVTGFAYRNVGGGANIPDYMASSSTTDDFGNKSLIRPDENSCTFKFTFRGQHLRIMNFITATPIARTYGEIVCDGVSFKLNTANYYKGLTDYVLFDYTFSTFGVHKVVVRQLPPQNSTDYTYPVGVDAIDIDESGEVLDNNLTPLYRYYSKSNTDHFYTSNYAEAGAGDPNGYAYEGIVGYIYNSQVSGTVPLYRYYSSVTKDHFYTCSYAEAGAGDPNGFMYEGIVGYVYNSEQAGLNTPVYRYYSSANTDHFYTSNYAEAGAGDPNGFILEGKAFYVIPN